MFDNKEQAQQAYDKMVSEYRKRRDELVEAAKQQAVEEYQDEVKAFAKDLESSDIPIMVQRQITRKYGDTVAFKRVMREGIL